jgi:hypothetical protein
VDDTARRFELLLGNDVIDGSRQFPK